MIEENKTRIRGIKHMRKNICVIGLAVMALCGCGTAKKAEEVVTAQNIEEFVIVQDTKDDIVGHETEEVITTQGIVQEQSDEESQEEYKYEVNWEDVRVEPFDYTVYTAGSGNTYTYLGVLYTYPEEYKTDTGLRYNAFSVIDDYYKFKLVVDDSSVYGDYYYIYRNSNSTDYRQMLGIYLLPGEHTLDSVTLLATDRVDESLEEHSWDNLSLVDTFVEPSVQLFDTNEGYYLVNDIDMGSGRSSDMGNYEFYTMRLQPLTKKENGKELSAQFLTGKFSLKTRDGQSFSEVSGMEEYFEITGNNIDLGIYTPDNIRFFDLAEDYGVVVEYIDDAGVQSWVVVE